MATTALLLAAAVGGFVPPASAMEHFPGAYFDSRVREPLQRRVMTSWPGPTGLAHLWRETELSEPQRAVVLIGSAVFHDPVMLPLYREALMAEPQILRQAAIYAYRDFTGLGPVNVNLRIDARIQEAFDREMRLLERTLRRHSLLEIWLQSALVQDGASLPGYEGLTFTRPIYECLRAAERLADVQDLDFLVVAYQLSADEATRIALLQLIEGLTLSQFLVLPTGDKMGWGKQRYINAHQSLEAWIEEWRNRKCGVDGEIALKKSFRREGVQVDDPFGPDAWRVWLAVLRKGPPRWWSLAARRLYACGGPWYELSILRPETEENRARRDSLDSWYRPFQTATPHDR